MKFARWILFVSILAVIAFALNAFINSRESDMERIAKEAASIKINIDEEKVKEMGDMIDRYQEQYTGH